MSKQCLDAEQMKHLQELGLDTSNGSAYWYRFVQNKVDGNIRVISDWKLTFSLNIAYCTGHTLESIRTFTLQDILDLLPKTIKKDIKTTFFLFIDYQYNEICYSVNILYKGMVDKKVIYIGEDSSLIDAAYEMLCWCIDNVYIKTNKDEQR